MKNGLGQVVIQFKKSPHKSNSLRPESISKLPRGKPMNVFYLKIFGAENVIVFQFLKNFRFPNFWKLFDSF